MKARTMTLSRLNSNPLVSRILKLDWILLLVSLAVVIIGIFMVHSTEAFGQYNFLGRQLAAAAIGFLGLLFFLLLPYQLFRGYVRPLYIGMILLLIAVLLGGETLRGTKGWFHIGPIYIQVSEIAKLIFILTLAGYLDRRIQWSFPKSLFYPFVIAMIPIGLILLQPDLSSSLGTSSP